MITNIYFIRHSQPDNSVEDETARPLTEKGVKDSKRVTITLLDKDIEAIYSSPYKRAFDTVKGLADANGIDIITIEGFKERKIHDTWIEDFTSFSRRQWEDFNFKLVSGESLKETQERNISALFDVLKDNLGKNIAIGSHGTALSTIINYFYPSFGYEGFLSIKDKMPYILCFRFNGMEFATIEEITLL